MNLSRTLNRPRPAWWSIGFWFIACTIFLVVTLNQGGAAPGDAPESIFGPWAIEHCDWACLYAPSASYITALEPGPIALNPPVYPLLSGAIASLEGIGHRVPFPTTSALGVNCQHGPSAIGRWSVQAHATGATLRLGYLALFVLAMGLSFIIRSLRRCTTLWELIGPLLVAISPPTYECLTTFFHPEDLLAIGFVLFGVAIAIRERWALAGTAVAVGLCTQQSALLVAVTLFFIAPRRSRAHFALGFGAVAAAINLGAVALTNGRAWSPVIFGSSRIRTASSGHFHSIGGTVLYELHLHGLILFFASRLLPLLCAGLMAWWVRRALGDGVVDAVVIVSLMSTALVLRLVFEENLFNYYFMPLVVGLVVIEVARGRFRGASLAWLGLVSFAFGVLPPLLNQGSTTGALIHLRLALAVFALFVLSFVVMLVHDRRLLRAGIPFVALCVLLIFSNHLPNHASGDNTPYWLWQILLVPTSVALCAAPWWQSVQRARGRDDELHFWRRDHQTSVIGTRSSS